MGWNETRGEYLCRVLSCPPHAGCDEWVVWPKDLAVESVSAPSELEAIEKIKLLCAKAINKAAAADPQEAIPWTDLSWQRTPGATLKWIGVTATAPKRVILAGKK